jgi:hypothetical protein
LAAPVGHPVATPPSARNILPTQARSGERARNRGDGRRAPTTAGAHPSSALPPRARAQTRGAPRARRAVWVTRDGDEPLGDGRLVPRLAQPQPPARRAWEPPSIAQEKGRGPEAALRPSPGLGPIQRALLL